MKKLLFTTIIAGTTVCSSIAIMFLGCGSQDKIGNPGTGSSTGLGGIAGAPVLNLDASATGRGGSSGQDPTADANCGSATSSTSQTPADVLLVLDRSGSMDESIAEECYCDPAKVTRGSNIKACATTAGCTTRWQSVTSALTTTLTNTPGIGWGLKFFSSPNGSGSNASCYVSNGADVKIGSTTAAADIQTQISHTSPANNTPTAAAITAATAYLKTVTDPNNKVILLATDGEPNCKAGGASGDGDVPGTTTAIKAALAAGFKVYVIGIGPSVGNLDSFAQSGGTDKSFPATTPQDLTNALLAISHAVAACTFTVTAPKDGTSNIAVYLGGQPAPSTDWTYNATTQTVAITGATCDAIKSATTAQTVQVYFGCGEPPPPKIN